jgi:hypothetical protein
MPVVVCPNCQRRLQLPDDVIGMEARCPICRTDFIAEPEGGRPRPISEHRDVPDPTAPWRPDGGRRDEPAPRRDGWRDDQRRRDSPPGRHEERELLQSAGAWLFGLSLASLIWNFTCGCGGLVGAVDTNDLPDEARIAFFVAHLGHLFSLSIILAGGQAMRNVSSRSLCFTGAVLAVLELLFLCIGLGLISAAVGGDTAKEVTVLLLLASLGLSLALMIAGIYAVNVLNRPGVEALFSVRRDDD